MSQPVDSQARPRLRRGVVLAPADQERWQARFDFDGLSFFEGDACVAVLPWLAERLDGIRTVDDLQKAPDRPCTSDQLQEVLSKLNEHGYVLDARSEPYDGESSTPIGAAVESLGPDSNHALSKVRAVQITVCGHSQLAELIAESLCQHGFNTPQRCRNDLDCTESSQKAINVIVETDFTCSQLEQFNRWAVGANRKWMLVGAWNSRVLIGPIFLPGETACYECYRRRLDSHRRHLAANQALESWRRQSAIPPLDVAEPVLPGIAQLAAAWTGLELFSYVASARPVRILGNVLVYEPDSLRITKERVLRIPWCATCSPYVVGTTRNTEFND